MERLSAVDLAAASTALEQCSWVTTNGVLTTLASFSGVGGGGVNPQAALTLGNDGNFYGTTSAGGAGDGTVFRVTSNGELTNICNFSYGSAWRHPNGLTLGNDGNFYGTTFGAYGSSYDGILFKVTTNGTLTKLVSFSGVDGANPQTTLVLAKDGNLYGTTLWGGILKTGTVFTVTASGILTSVVSFNGTNGAAPTTQGVAHFSEHDCSSFRNPFGFHIPVSCPATASELRSSCKLNRQDSPGFRPMTVVAALRS